MKLRMRKFDELFRNTIFSLLELSTSDTVVHRRLVLGIYRKEKVRNFVYTFTESSQDDGRRETDGRDPEAGRSPSLCLFTNA